MLVVKNKNISFLWELNSIFMYTLWKKKMPHWPPKWPPCHVACKSRINQILPMLLSSHLYDPLPLLPAHLSGERKQYDQNGGQYQCRGCSFWRHQKATRSREMQQRMGNTKRALLLGSYGRYYRRSTERSSWNFVSKWPWGTWSVRYAFETSWVQNFHILTLNLALLSWKGNWNRRAVHNWFSLFESRWVSRARGSKVQNEIYTG